MIGVELETLDAISVNFLEGPKDERELFLLLFGRGSADDLDLNAMAVEGGAFRWASDAVAKEGGRL